MTPQKLKRQKSRMVQPRKLSGKKSKGNVNRRKFKPQKENIVILPAAKGDLPLDDRVNHMINLSTINSAISSQFTTVSAYCKNWNITKEEMSRFLNKKIPITLKMLLKHCDNLGIVVQIILTKG